MSSKPSSASLPHQKALLPNPFLISDSEILEKVYQTHTYDDEVCDKQSLFNLVSNVIIRSTQIVETGILKVTFAKCLFIIKVQSLHDHYLDLLHIDFFI